MISTRWLERRKQHWDRLERLLDQTRSYGIRGLSRGELRELSLLYRQSAADVSVLREDAASQQAVPITPSMSPLKNSM